MRVIVRLRQDADAALLTRLSRATDARLELMTAIAPDLVVLDVNARNGSADCAATLERMRSDPRVRSVDLDERRRTQGLGGPADDVGEEPERH